jgi:integral membrane protein (TIGR01906 family)
MSLDRSAGTRLTAALGVFDCARQSWFPTLPPAALVWAWRGAIALFVVAVLTLPIAWSVRFSAQSGAWWERGFDTYDVERRTGLARVEVDRAGAELRAYFVSSERNVAINVTNAAGDNEALFTTREVQHLVDVKRLLVRTYDAGWASIGFIVAFVTALLLWRRQTAAALFARASRIAGVVVATVIVVLGVTAITGFDGAFRQFHLLFFTNDLWQLSSRDRLIQMFPQGFFFDTTMLIGATTVTFAALLAGAGWWYGRRHPAAPREDVAG